MAEHEHYKKIQQLLGQLLSENGYLNDGEGLIKACLLYGSQVYGSLHQHSDHDYLIVIDESRLEKPLDVIIAYHHGGGIELSIYGEQEFEKLLLEEAEIHQVEAIFTPTKFVLVGEDWLNKLRTQFQSKLFGETRSEFINIIRHTFSRKSANSEVKARKKIIDGEVMIGLKSVFHSIRLLHFGMQLGLYGEICDFRSAIEAWEEIMERFVPRENDGGLTPEEIKEFYKKWVKTPYRLPNEPESIPAKHLLSRFKESLPKQ